MSALGSSSAIRTFTSFCIKPLGELLQPVNLYTMHPRLAAA
jgi:hypothetical protein